MGFRTALIALVLIAAAARAGAQTPDRSRKWEILDNSFLVEESFNQEPGVVQNIFSWTRSRHGEWAASFTQEWPAPGVTHQLSYTIPFSRVGEHRGLNDVLLNYRYQLQREGDGRPAISPRLSLILPTGRGVAFVAAAPLVALLLAALAPQIWLLGPAYLGVVILALALDALLAMPRSRLTRF